AGEPGTSFKVRVYGTDSACSATASTISKDVIGAEDLRVSAVSSDGIHTVQGRPAAISNDGTLDLGDLAPAPTQNSDPQSCSSTGGAPLLWAALGIAAMFVLRPSRKLLPLRVARKVRK